MKILPRMLWAIMLWTMMIEYPGCVCVAWKSPLWLCKMAPRPVESLAGGQGATPTRDGGRNGQSTHCRGQTYRPPQRAAGRGRVGCGRAGAPARSASAAAAPWSVADDDHRCPGSRLRGEHAGAAMAQRA